MKQNSIYAFSSYSKIASLKCHSDRFQLPFLTRFTQNLAKSHRTSCDKGNTGSPK